MPRRTLHYKRVLRAVLNAGAVPAQAGEFTKRAFLNGKIDLTEAEAVIDIISAKSRGAARSALCVKEGALRKKIDGVKMTSSQWRLTFLRGQIIPRRILPRLRLIP